MASRRTRASRITEDEINELICKLQAVIPETRRSGTTRASASEILRETCNYIKGLNREVEDLSERLSVLLATKDTNNAEAQLLKSILVAAIASPRDSYCEG